MPRPPQIPLPRVLLNMFGTVSDPIKYFNRYVAEYGKDFLLSVGGTRKTHMTVNADLIQHVLRTNHKNYHKSAIQTDDLARYIGHGLLTNNGRNWLTQRRLIQPGFHRKRLAALVTEMQIVISERCAHLDTIVAAGRPVVLQEITTDIVFRVIARAIFTDGFNEADTKALGDAMDAVQNYVIYPVRMPFLLNPLTWLGIEGKKLEIVENIRQSLGERIGARRAGSPGDDLLQMLLDSRYEDTGAPMADRRIIDEIMILFAAGHETSANALSWIIWLLLRHPDELDRVRAEIASVEAVAPLGFDNALQLTCLTQVIEESMRLYPPAWITDRVALEPDHAAGIDIAAGTTLGIFFYGLHRHPDHWDEPDAFRPERMHPDAKKERHPFCFLPFGGGPRLCIGNHFAMLEMQLILARLLRDYDFLLPAEAEKLNFKPVITLQMKAPLVLKVSRRRL